MSTKSNQSLDDLRSHARLSYRYWHIYLYLRLREVEQHLASAERAELGEAKQLLGQTSSSLDLGILIEYGLWDENEIVPSIDEPSYRELANAEHLVFRVGASLTSEGLSEDYCSLSLVAVSAQELLHIELLRVRSIDSQILASACNRFNSIAEEVSIEVAYEAAQLWAALHGARSLDWSDVPEGFIKEFMPEVVTMNQSQVTQNGKYRQLPPRKRGKGMFREPK